jgi:hypothetical protein
MKKLLIFSVFMILAINAFSQENSFTISGGYPFGKVEGTDTKCTGWKINGLYEFNPAERNTVLGFSTGYQNLTASESGRNYTVSSIPLYFAPKYMKGNDKLKAFIKGAIGAQYSWMTTTTSLSSLSDHDYGFVGGGGAGFTVFLNEKYFLNAEYEILWMSNSFYRDGWINSLSGGLGVKF